MTDAPAKKGLPVPHSEDAEQALLGGLLIDRSAYIDVDGLLKTRDFYLPAHQVIFDSIESLMRADQPADIVTVMEAMTRAGTLQEGGGLPYLAQLQRDTPGASNALQYAKIVKDRAVRREMIELGRRMAAMASLGFEREDLDVLQGEILNVTTERMTADPIQLFRGLSSYTDEIDARAQRGDRLIGPSTGFEDLDKLTLGFEPGTLWYIGARPSMGKTSLAIKIAERMALQRGEATAFFSAEMPASQIYDRLLANTMPTPLTDIRSGQLSEKQWESLTRAVKTTHDKPFYIDDTPNISIAELRAKARRLHQKHKLKLIIVDYLQLMSAPGHDENAIITNISKGLKALAKELGVTLLALAQLNREVEKRDVKRPFLSDLRGSGSVEQDGDVIAFLWADDPNRPYRNLSLAKHRNGALGDIQLSWTPQTVCFDDVDHQQQLEWAREEETKREQKKPRKSRNPLSSGADARAGTDR